MNDRPYHFSLRPLDFGQLIDGLCARRDAWTKTVQLLRGELDELLFIGEECDGEEEAQQIADHYSEIIETLQAQAEPQRGLEKPTLLERPPEGEIADGWCLYTDTLCGGCQPAERTDDGFAVYSTERQALEECAEEMIGRYQEFLRGEREVEEIDNGLFVVAVTLHPDGIIADEWGHHEP